MNIWIVMAYTGYGDETTVRLVKAFKVHEEAVAFCHDATKAAQHVIEILKGTSSQTWKGKTEFDEGCAIIDGEIFYDIETVPLQ